MKTQPMPEFRNYMAEYGDRLVLENDWHAIPAKPGTKIPGCIKAGEWAPMPGWSKYCLTKPTSTELMIWKRWPGCGIGIACGYAIGIDIDVEDETQALRIQAIAMDVFGYTPLIRVGNAPRRMLVYRCGVKLLNSQDRPKVQILAKGRQFIGFGWHPNGYEYKWINESPLDVSIHQVPAITQEQIDKFFERVYREVLTPDVLPPGKVIEARHHFGADHQPSFHGLEGTVEAIASAMEAIPNHDLDWDAWKNTGLAIKRAIGEAGFPIWAAWSAKSAKNRPDRTESEWRGIRPQSVQTLGAGSIYHQAMQNGWLPPPGLHLNPEKAELAQVASSEEVKAAIQNLKTRKTARGTDRPPVPDAIFDLAPHGVRLFIDEAAQRGKVPLRWLGIGAALTMFGALAGRKYQTASGLRSNFYVTSVGPTGIGKDVCRHLIMETLELFNDGTDEQYLGCDRYTSEQAIISELIEHPARVILWDEFGHVLRAITDEGAPGHLKSIADCLTKLFTSANKKFLGSAYADRRMNKPQRIAQPTLCIYGTTVPDRLYQALQGGHVADGFLTRFLLFRTESDFLPDTDPNQIKKRPVPRDLIDMAKAIKAGAAGHPYAVMQMTTEAGLAPGEPYTVPQKQEVTERMRQMEIDQFRRQGAEQRAGHAVMANYLSRRCEHIFKVAMMAAVADNPAYPEVTMQNLTWAEMVVDRCIADAVQDVAEYVADNRDEAASKAVERKIKEAGKIKHSDLMARCRNINAMALRGIIGHLIDSGIILKAETKSDAPGRPLVEYVWNGRK